MTYNVSMGTLNPTIPYHTKGRDHVEVYDVTTYQLLRCLTLPPNRRGFTDMTICGYYRCVYVGDYGVECVHRVGLHDGATTQWLVNDTPYGVSVNKAHNVLVTCRVVRKIKEFSSDGNLLRELTCLLYTSPSPRD